MKKFEAQMLSGEIAGGQTTVEYVVVVAIVLGLAVALIAFRNELRDAIGSATNQVKNLFANLSNAI